MENELELMEKTIIHIAEQVLGINRTETILKRSPIFYGCKRRGMMFRGSLALSLPLTQQERGRIIRYFDIIITAEHNVFACWYRDEQLRINNSLPNPKNFENLSNHDVGWTDSINKTFQENFWAVSDELNHHLRMKDLPALKPIEMQIHIELGAWLGNNPLRFVEVEMRHPNNESYFYNLTSIKFRNVTMDFIPEPA